VVIASRMGSERGFEKDFTVFAVLRDQLHVCLRPRFRETLALAYYFEQFVRRGLMGAADALQIIIDLG
jgi:hypothetical protein